MVNGTFDKLDSVEVYAPATTSWARLASNLPTARSRLAAATGADKLIYTMGGFHVNNQLATIEVYVPSLATYLPWLSTGDRIRQ